MTKRLRCIDFKPNPITIKEVVMQKIAIGDILGARHGKCAMGCGFVGLLLGSGICITCKEDLDEKVDLEGYDKDEEHDLEKDKHYNTCSECGGSAYIAEERLGDEIYHYRVCERCDFREEC